MRVDYYGSEVPLQQLAGFTVPEPRVLVIQPYDKGAMAAIEKAIQQSDLGINPSNDGQVVRLVFPELTEERRKEMVKVVKHQAEEGRVAVRNVRRHARQELEALEKAGEISRDELERIEKDLEKATHEVVAEVDQLLAHKEHELLEVLRSSPDGSSVREASEMAPSALSEVGPASGTGRVQRRSGVGAGVPDRWSSGAGVCRAASGSGSV